MTTLDEFLCDREMNHPIREGVVGRTKLLATELALGVHLSYWPRRISLRNHISDANLNRFLSERWNLQNNAADLLEPLRGHGFLERESEIVGNYHECISTTAFDLLQETAPFRVFVSYRWLESSAFALLVVNRLKEHGLRSYCDMRIAPGDEWRPELEVQVRACELLVVLLGPSTLCSEAVIQEIRWAMDSDAKIIPITHNCFEFNREEWQSRVPSCVVDKIDYNHRISIPSEHESAAGYDTAIRTLLTNRFGITP